MKEYIKKLLREAIDNIVKCKKCGWSWKKSEAGPDMYFCHKCGQDNTPDNIKENLEKQLIYHGGERILTNLDPKYIKGGVRGIHGWGVYFSDSIHKAKDYGKEITVLDISNMNILDTNKIVDKEFINSVEKLSQNTESINLSALYDVIASKLKKEIGKDIDIARKNIADTFKWDINEIWSKMLVKLGYDIMKNGYEYVVINFDKANEQLMSLNEEKNKVIKENKVAGVLIKCEETNKILLLLRNDKKPTWSLVSGVIENDEDPIECLKREIVEELSINPELIKISKVGVEMFNDKNIEFHYCEGLTYKEFIPKLNSENTDWGWFGNDDLPSPLYKGMKEKIENIYGSE